MRPRGVGQSGPIPSSSITTSSTKAATSRPGSSRNSSRPSFVPRSGHSANHSESSARSATWPPADRSSSAKLNRGLPMNRPPRSGPTPTKRGRMSCTRHRQLGKTIRSFRVNVPEEALVDLRRRIAATRWPERENVSDFSQGAQLGKIQPLVRHWGTDYDWRNAEAKLNALPQFVTTIGGLDIQFTHVRSRHPNAMPLIMTHGWPGSVFELLKTVGPLTDPTAHGGNAEDAFHLVLPTYPGYGFSGKPQGIDWGPDRVARAWHELMQRLGYKEYVSQGGDWGAIISEVMAVQAPEGLLGIHTNMPGTVPPSVLRLIRNRDSAPSSFSDAEKVAFAGLEYFYHKGFGYAEMMNTRPQTLGYALADSPVGMFAFFYDKFTEWTYGRDPEKSLTRDEM